MDIPHFVYHSSVDGPLGCFHFLAILNHVAMNIHVPKKKKQTKENFDFVTYTKFARFII